MAPSQIDQEPLREQLERIVRSPTFARSPQAGKFLRYVVEQTLEGRAESLKAFTIGLQALGAQAERSDPDSIARMQARRVRKLLDSYYASLGTADPWRIVLPTGSYQPAFEPNTRPDPEENDEKPTLIVEGYVAQGPAEFGRLLAEALEEATAAALLSFGAWRVWRAPKSVSADSPTFILAGTVWLVAGRVRVFSALRDARSGERLWYDRFDGSYTEERFFELQDEICDCVCSRIGDPTVGVIAKTLRGQTRQTKSTLALAQFHDHALSPYDPGVESALGLLERALAEEPNSATLLSAAALLGTFLYASDPTENPALLDEAEARARHAVALEPRRYDARLAKGIVHFHRREREAASCELERALAENPRALLALYWVGVYAALLGDWERGLQLLSLATSRFIEAPGFHHLPLALHQLVVVGSADGAYFHAKLIDTPYAAWGPLISAVCLLHMGRRYEARRALQEAMNLSPSFAGDPRAYVAGSVADGGAFDAILEALDELGLRRNSDSSPPAPTTRRGVSPGAQRRVVTVGILHSLTGTMAICERPLVDAALLAIEEINELGGVLGRQVVPIVEDGASEPDVFVSRARKLLECDKSSTLFGCWTSSSRKAIRPVLEHYNALLWYPVQYEGLERSRHIVYTGSCLNQQIEPATRWALGQGKREFFLVGSDYVFPRTANHLIRTIVDTGGGEVVAEEYRPLGGAQFAGVVERIRRVQPDLILSTINGADNLAFFAELARAGLDAATCPVMSFSLSELELSRVPGVAEGHYACWSYFQSLVGPENGSLQERFRLRYGADFLLADPTATAYAQVHLWKRAVDTAGSLRTDDVLAHLVGQRLRLGEDWLEVHANHHVERRALIGKIRRDGQFDVVWASESPISPKPWLGVEDSNLDARDLIVGALGSLPDVVDYTTSLEREMHRHRPPERGMPPKTEN